MPKEKFKLSETVRFLSRKLNAITGGGEVSLTLDMEAEQIEPGSELTAHARLRSPEQARQLDHLVLGMRGTIQRDGQWRDYIESAEVAQRTELPADHELIIPIMLYIPEDAVLTEDGAHWHLEARAALDGSIDARAQLAFTIAY